VEALDAKDNVVLAAPGRCVALIGVEGLAVVEGPEGLLVGRLALDQRVRQVAQRAPAVKSLDVRAPSQGRELDVRIIEPPEVGPETGFLLMYHGYANSRLQHQATMERWAARYDVVCVAPEYRDSGFDAYPNGLGAREPYDFSHLQLVDGLNAYRAARLRYAQADGQRAYVWGGSQGGHLALLSAELAAGTFALCVALSNVACPKGTDAQGRPRFSEAGLAIRDARRWAARAACPVVLVHGTADPTTPETNTRELARALAEAGRDFAARFVPGGDHRLGPVASWEEVTEELADAALRTNRRSGPDDFETARAYEFPCPGGVTWRLDFRSGLAEFSGGV
jgi:dipeptidyl aminopeptidase/acylaminoacyl peptidase